MKKLIFFILCILCKNVYSQAVSDTVVVSNSNTDTGKFEFVTKFTSGEKVYALVEKRNYGTVKVWVKLEKPIKYKKSKKGKAIKTGGGYDVLHIILYCENRNYDFEKGIKYDSNGKVISHSNTEQYQVSIIPETLFDYVRKYICY